MDATSPRAFVALLEEQASRLSDRQRAALLTAVRRAPANLVEIEREDGQLVANVSEAFLKLLERNGVELPGWMR